MTVNYLFLYTENLDHMVMKGKGFAWHLVTLVMLKYWFKSNKIRKIGSNLLSRGMHLVKGSPVKDSLQLHIGLWFFTTHLVLRPQALEQGSLHFCRIHALLDGHSALRTHSGLHPGGLPTYSGKQVQTACSLFTRHWLLGPQGDGKQGFLGFSVNTT